MQFKFTVRGDRITRENENSFVEGNQNSYTAVFDFGNDANWDNVAKLCVIETDSGDVYRLPIFENGCTLPVLEKGRFEIGVMGVLTYDGEVIEGEEGIVISTNMYPCEAIRGAATKEANAELNNAAQVWMKYIGDMEDKRVSCAESADEARISAESAKESATSALKIADMTVSAENLPEGEPANVIKTEDEDSLHLTFYIPKGEKGNKGDVGEKGPKGDKGDIPIKGTDYFTPEDIQEFNNTPKEVVKFANGLKLESRDDGVYLIYKIPISETEEITEEKMLFLREGVIYADESEYAVFAECDTNGNPFTETYVNINEYRSHLEKDFMSVLSRLDVLEQAVEESTLPDGDEVYY